LRGVDSQYLKKETGSTAQLLYHGVRRRSALNNDRVRVAPEFIGFLPEFCRSVSHTGKTFPPPLSGISFPRLPELGRNLSVPARVAPEGPDPLSTGEFPRPHLKLYSMRDRLDRRKVQRTASPHWGWGCRVAGYSYHKTMGSWEGCTLSRNAAVSRWPFPSSHVPVCRHSHNSSQHITSILSVITDNVVSWNRKRTSGFQLGFFLRYPLSYGMPSIACSGTPITIETNYVCEDRGLTYIHCQGHARWSEVTCTGSGSRMQFTRR
jgi:hypothetical protein